MELKKSILQFGKGIKNEEISDNFDESSLEWLILLAAIKSRNKNPIGQLDLAQLVLRNFLPFGPGT